MNIVVLGGTRWRVIGNTCDDGDYAGISLHAAQADLDDSEVTANRVARMSGRGIQITSSHAFRVRRILVSRNEIRSCGDRGILVCADGVRVDGNLVEDASQAGIVVGDPHQPALPAAHVGLFDNIIRATRRPAPAIHVLAGSSDVVIMGNSISDASVGILNQASDLTTGGNRYVRVSRPGDPAPSGPEP
jgi:hypothetical protein